MRVALGLALVSVAACYTPAYVHCAVSCSSTADCAPDQVCGTSGLCAAPDQACDAAEGPPPPDAPISVAGTYSVSLTNRENGCSFPDWTVGQSLTNVGVVVTQSGATTFATPQGLVAAYLDLWLGAHVFAGASNGRELDLLLAGNKNQTRGGCTYTIDATIDARITGDVIEGNLYYRARTGVHPACNSLRGCSTRQQLNGTRPPS